MRNKLWIYYGIGFIIASAIGYSINYIVGFLAAFVLYVVFIVLLSIIFGLSDADPVEKSIYERRKKNSE